MRMQAICLALTLGGVAIAPNAYSYTDFEVNQANISAANFAAVANTVAARFFELGPRFTVVYPSGKPPTTDLKWLKDPANCALSGIPTLPLKENSEPISASFLPCSTSDTDQWGNSYGISWSGTYPNVTITIQLGAKPFLVNGIDRGDIAGMISMKASSLSTATALGYSSGIFVSYNYSVTNGALTSSIVRTGASMEDGRLRTDGSNAMDSDASISWGNGMSINPEADGSMTLNSPTVKVQSILASGDITTDTLTAQSISSGNIDSSGTVHASARLSTDEYLSIGGIATQDTACAQNGLIARDDDGATLSCTAGTWKASGKGTEGYYCRYTSFDERKSWDYVGPSPLSDCKALNYGETGDKCTCMKVILDY